MRPLYCRVFVLTLFAVLGAAQECHAAKVLSEERDGGGLWRMVLLEPWEFSDESLVQFSRDSLAAERLTFQQGIFLSKESQKYDFWPVSHRPFDVWAKKCGAISTTPSQVAELISIQENSLLRIRTGTEIREVVLSGENPLRFNVLEADVTVLSIQIFKGTGIQAEAVATVRPSLELGRGILSELKLRMANEAVLLHLSSVPWFPSEESGLASCWWVPPPLPENTTIDARTLVTCGPRVHPYEDCRIYVGK